MLTDRTEKRAFAVSMIAASLLAGLDFWSPTGFGGGFPYIPVVLLSLLSASRRSIFVTAAVCTVLPLLAYLCSSQGSDSSTAIGARLMAVGGVWMTTLCCFYGNRLVAAFDEMLGSGIPPSQNIDVHTESDTRPNTSSVTPLRKELRTHSEDTTTPIKKLGQHSGTQSAAPEQPLYQTERKLRRQFEQQTRELTLAYRHVESEKAKLIEVEQASRATGVDLRRQNEELASAFAAAERKLEFETARHEAAVKELRQAKEQLRRQTEDLADGLWARAERADVVSAARETECLLEHRIGELSNALTVAEEKLRCQSQEQAQERATADENFEAEKARCVDAEESAKEIEHDLQNQLQERSDVLTIVKNELEAEANTRAATDRALSNAQEDLQRLSDEHRGELATAREQVASERSQRIDAERNAQTVEDNLKHRVDELSNALTVAEDNLRRQSHALAQERTAVAENLEAEKARCVDAGQAAQAIEDDLHNQLKERSNALAIAKKKLQGEANTRADADRALSNAEENLQRLSDKHERELATAREQVASERTRRIDAEREAQAVEDNLKRRIEELTNDLHDSREDLLTATDEHSETQSALHQAEEHQRRQSDERTQELATVSQEAEAENARRAEAARMIEHTLERRIDYLTNALGTAKDELHAEIVKHVAATEAFSKAEEELRRQIGQHARELAAANERTEVATFQRLESHGQNERDLTTGPHEPTIESIPIEQNCCATAECILDQTAERTALRDAVNDQPPATPPAEDMDVQSLSIDSDEVALIERFVGELVDKSYAIRQTLRDQDFEALKTLARDLVTPAERSGFGTIARAAKELETMATTGQVDELVSQVKRLRSLCELGVISHGLWSHSHSASTNS